MPVAAKHPPLVLIPCDNRMFGDVPMVVLYNRYFTLLAQALSSEKINLEQTRELLTEALPGMAPEWARLERIDVWSDGLQFWFADSQVRDICLRPSGTDAKTKVYFDGTDKAYLKQLFEGNFQAFVPRYSPRYLELIPDALKG